MGDTIGGHKIGAVTTGDHSPVIIDSQNISIVNNQVDKLAHEINTLYSKDDKEVILGEVRQIKELATDNKNYPKIRFILGSVITKTSEFATIATCAIELLKIFTT